MQNEVEMTALQRLQGQQDADAEGLSEEIQSLKQALLSRDVIGQAKGILMERCRVSADEAFEQLRLASQRLNRKVHDLATELARTGQWPPE
jgi:AmiR/NasT family two-component response regulator